MSENEAQGARCWHCGKPEREKAQILCKECLADAQELIIPLIPEHFDKLRTLEADNQTLRERVGEMEAGVQNVAFLLSGFAPYRASREHIEKVARALISPAADTGGEG